MKIRVLIGTWILMVACLSCDLWSQSSLQDQFRSSGIQLAEGASVQLPQPLLWDKKPSEVKELLEKLSQRHGWERFSRNSPTAPVHVETTYALDASEKRIGHNVYSAFIAYAPLASLKDQELMTSLFGSSSEDKELMGFDPKALPADILEKAGVSSIDSADVRYSTLRIPLMNRVVVEGTARIDRNEQEGCIIISWQLDPHFSFDIGSKTSELASYANRYRKVVRDELGKEVESAPVAYSGCGGYLCVMQTGIAEDQLLIESRLAIREPDEWFAGSNFLRSKFPAALQESAQSFRRKLSKSKK